MQKIFKKYLFLNDKMVLALFNLDHVKELTRAKLI